MTLTYFFFALLCALSTVFIFLSDVNRALVLVVYFLFAVLSAVFLFGRTAQKPKIALLKKKTPSTKSVSNEEAKTVFKSFKKAVEERDAQKSSFYKHLKESILEKIVKTCSYKVFSITDDEGKYLIFLNGKSDSLLMIWAKLCFFPRGLPILFDIKTGKILSDSGFLPKFDNDHNGHTKTSFDNFSDVTMMKITKKFSGHLTGVILYYTDQGEPTFTVVSKKSADPESKFVKEPMYLWDSILSPDIIIYFLNKGITTLWGECLGTYDQTHGAPVSKDTIVLTSAGRTSEYSLDDSPTSVINDELKELLTPIGLDKNMARSYIFKNPEVISKLCSELSDKRDFMSNSLFNEIIGKNYKSESESVSASASGIYVYILSLFSFVFGKFFIKKSESDIHDTILGDRLEGIIIHLLTSDGWKTVKYKFTPYVVLTMFLRETSKSGVNKLGMFENGKYCPLPSTVTAIEKFISRWVFNPVNSDYYRGYCLSLCQKQDEMNDTTQVEVAKWIRADLKISTETVKPISKEELQASVSPYFKTVYIILGSVGYGKSSFADALCKYMNKLHQTDNFVHVDGDKPGYIPNLPEDANGLGEERNDVYRAIILKLLSEGQTPVVSCGGGILKDGFGQKSTWIFECLTKTLGVFVKPVFFTPPDNSLTDENLKKWVEDAVKYRCSKGLYKDQPNIRNELIATSKRNKPLWSSIREEFKNDTHTFDPAVEGVGVIPVGLYVLLGKSKHLPSEVNQMRPLKVNQIRRLVKIGNKFYHKTFYYNFKVSTVLNYDPSEKSFKQNRPLYEFKELVKKGKEKGKEKVVLALVLTEGEGHITVSSGPFAKKLMGVVENFLRRNVEQEQIVLKAHNCVRTFCHTDFTLTMVNVTFMSKFGF